MRRLANASNASERGPIDPIQQVCSLLHFPKVNSVFQIVRLQSAHLPHFNAAVASSLRDGPVRGQEYAYKALGNSTQQVLLIHVSDFGRSVFGTAMTRARPSGNSRPNGAVQICIEDTGVGAPLETRHHRGWGS